MHHFFHIFLFLLLLEEPVDSFRFREPPEVKVVKWIPTSASAWEIEHEAEETWNFDFEDIPKDALQILDRGETIIVSQHVSGLGIVCNSSWPVEWIFEQAEHSHEEAYDIMMKTSRESEDVNNSRNDRFLAILELFGGNPTITGSYVCRSTDNLGAEKRIFIYWDGSSPPYLVLSGRTVHIYSEDNNTVILPCYVSQPDIEVKLFQEVTGVFKIISEEAGVKFDPKVGYTIDHHRSTLKDLYGRYKCLTDAEDDEVNIIVEREPPPKREFKNVMASGTILSYDHESEEIVCCARKGKPPPILHLLFCYNPSMCKMKEHKLLKVGNNGKKITNGSCIISDKIYMRDYGLLRCKGDGIDILRPFYTDFAPIFNETQGVYFNFKDINPNKMMHLTIHDKGPYYHMQTIAAICESMNSYFSDGHKWEIRWRDNTLTSYQPIDYIDDPHIHGLRFADIKLHWKMYELICYAPVWNTTEWVSKSVKLDVQKSSPPMITGLSLEEIKMVFNETERLLECKSFARPTASVKWTKNGEDVPKSMIILNELGTSIIMFRRVTLETAAEYKCIAKNIVGEVSKIIKVVVEDLPPTSSAWGTTAAVLVPLLIIGFVITAGGLIWKMQLQKKIVDHLSRVVFRDSERQNEYPAT